MSDRPSTPDAPLIVEGEVLPGDTRFMLRCMIEELLCGGVAPRQIREMARDGNYQALFAARETLGADAFDDLLQAAAAAVGVHGCRVREIPPTCFDAALTVHGAADEREETPMEPASACTCSSAEHADAVAFLKQEHRVIERVLDAVEHELATRGVTPALMWPALEFLAGFADGCHHHKEEAQLFPLLEERGVPRDGGPIGCMLSEHDVGRALMKRMRSSLVAIETGDRAAEVPFRAAAAQYIAHLRQHIVKEDDVLFVMAERLLSDPERASMAERFYDFERSAERRGTHDRFVALAETLHRRAFSAPPATDGRGLKTV